MQHPLQTMKISNGLQETLSFFDLVVSANHPNPKFESPSSFPIKIDPFSNNPFKTNLLFDSAPFAMTFQTIGWLLSLQVTEEIYLSLVLAVFKHHRTLKSEISSLFSLKFELFTEKQIETNFPADTSMFLVSFRTIG